jgi:hypothetical protein
MKQTNLHRGGRPLGLSANRANESGVATPHSDSSGVDRQIPRGIAILIDILAHEALKEVIAQHSKLKVRDHERQQRAQSGKPNETAIASPGVTKTKSCPQQEAHQTDLVQQNQIDIKIKSVLLVAGA